MHRIQEHFLNTASLPPRTTAEAAKKKPVSESVAKGPSTATPSYKDKVRWYCTVTKKKVEPTFISERIKGASRKYIGKAYIPQTCGWITGDPKRTKGEAEEDAAAKLAAKLNI